MERCGHFSAALFLLALLDFSFSLVCWVPGFLPEERGPVAVPWIVSEQYF